MLKHPYRDYYVYRGLTRNNNDYSNNTFSTGKSHSTFWVILFMFLMYLGKGDSSFEIAVIVLFAIPIAIAFNTRRKINNMNQREMNTKPTKEQLYDAKFHHVMNQVPYLPQSVKGIRYAHKHLNPSEFDYEYGKDSYYHVK